MALSPAVRYGVCSLRYKTVQYWLAVPKSIMKQFLEYLSSAVNMRDKYEYARACAYTHTHTERERERTRVPPQQAGEAFCQLLTYVRCEHGLHRGIFTAVWT